MKKIGFIGVGIMGKSMVRNLLKNGFEVSVYARTRAKVEDVLAEGALWCDSIARCAAGRDAVITIVGFPADVEEVYFSANGILDSADAGTCLIDMTTSSPELARRIFDAAAQKGCPALDAPVSGGDMGAKKGTLTIMVGGDEKAYEACHDIFAAMGTNIVYHGEAGNGQHVKMANQIMIAGALSGVSEALAYARCMGLDCNKLLQSVATGSAGSHQLDLYGERILNKDYAAGFYIKHFVKDMRIAAEQAQKNGLELCMLNTVLSVFETLQQEGHGDDGTQFMTEYYTQK